MGGFGKSALTWHWLQNEVDPARRPRVVWWSLYETDATFETFLSETLAYLGHDPTTLGPRQQGQTMLRALHQPGLFLVLDGFERALRAYSGLGAAYQGDAVDPQTGAAGPGIWLTATARPITTKWPSLRLRPCSRLWGEVIRLSLRDFSLLSSLEMTCVRKL